MRYLGMLAALGLILAVTATAGAITFTGTQAGKPPLSGTISFDASNMYVSATVGQAALAWDEDYLAIALDCNNDDLWTEGLDVILAYRAYNNEGATWRVVDTLEYSGGVWDCPWSSSDKRLPGDADWPTGLTMTVAASGQDYVYNATIPFSAMEVSAGDTIGILVQGFDKNVSIYGGNGRAINFWPNSTCFNALYDPAQFYDVQLSASVPVSDPIPEPMTMAGLVLGVGSLVGYIRRRRG